MYERLSDKNNIPTMEEFVNYIGTCKEYYRYIDIFLTSELKAEKKLTFGSDRNVRGWGFGYRSKKIYLCSVIAEKDAFTVIYRLSDEQIGKVYNEEVSLYAKECLDNYQRTSNGG